MDLRSRRTKPSCGLGRNLPVSSRPEHQAEPIRALPLVFRDSARQELGRVLPLDALEADLPVEPHEVIIWQAITRLGAELRGCGLQQGRTDTAALVMGVYAHASQNRRPMFRHEPEQADYVVDLAQREQDGSGRLEGATVVPVSIETPYALEVRGNGSPDSTHASLLPNGSRISCGESR